MTNNDFLESFKRYADHYGFSSVEEYMTALHEANTNAPQPLRRPDTKREVRPRPSLFHRTKLGRMYCGDSRSLLRRNLKKESVDLIVTSPPFGLVRPKEYGNEDSDRYVVWFDEFAEGFKRVLKDTGSLVIDIGGAWKKGIPSRSLYHYSLLISLCRHHGFHLAQEFYWWNPAKLPLPAEWVNIRRIRVRDSINCVWWLSKTPFPKASNTRVLQPYSDDMKKLLKRGSYNSGSRPGGHVVGEDSFLTSHNGAIPHNLLSIANTSSNSRYQNYCKKEGLKTHPARFPESLPAFFIQMLTDPGDLVLDPFGGSCVTGAVSEEMQRRWICCEQDGDYLEGAMGWFESEEGSPPLSANLKVYDAHPPPINIDVATKSLPLDPSGGRKRVNKP